MYPFLCVLEAATRILSTITSITLYVNMVELRKDFHTYIVTVIHIIRIRPFLSVNLSVNLNVMKNLFKFCLDIGYFYASRASILRTSLADIDKVFAKLSLNLLPSFLI